MPDLDGQEREALPTDWQIDRMAKQREVIHALIRAWPGGKDSVSFAGVARQVREVMSPMSGEWAQLGGPPPQGRCGYEQFEPDNTDTPITERQALEGINAIRNSIIGAQTWNWSEHGYPLVSLLKRAGFPGLPYPEAKEYVGTLIERAEVAEAALAAREEPPGDGEQRRRADTERPEEQPRVRAWLQREGQSQRELTKGFRVEEDGRVLFPLALNGEQAILTVQLAREDDEAGRTAGFLEGWETRGRFDSPEAAITARDALAVLEEGLVAREDTERPEARQGITPSEARHTTALQRLYDYAHGATFGDTNDEPTYIPAKDVEEIAADALGVQDTERPDEPTRALAEFHDALGDERGRGNAALRLTLHKEEHEELLDELSDKRLGIDVREPKADEDVDRTKLARELADVVYISYGTAHAFAIDLDAALREIHRAAMSKLDPATMVVREDGKVMKPPGFVPPDMSQAVRDTEQEPKR